MFKGGIVNTWPHRILRTKNGYDLVNSSFFFQKGVKSLQIFVSPPSALSNAMLGWGCDNTYDFLNKGYTSAK